MTDVEGKVLGIRIIGWRARHYIKYEGWAGIWLGRLVTCIQYVDFGTAGVVKHSMKCKV